MYGELSFTTQNAVWASSAAQVDLQLPPNRRFLVLGLIATGPTGSRGDSVIVNSILDTRRGRQYVVSNATGLTGVPFRSLGHCGQLNIDTGPTWHATRSVLLKRLRMEAALVGRPVDPLVNSLTRLFRTGELPPIAGFVVHGGSLRLGLATRNSDQPTSFTALMLELGSIERGVANDHITANPFFFSHPAQTVGTDPSSSLQWTDQVDYSSDIQARDEKFKHASSRLSLYNASTGAVLSEEHLFALSGQRPRAGGPYFYASNIPAPAAANGTGLFDVEFFNGDQVIWNGTKGTTSASALAYLSHQFVITEE